MTTRNTPEASGGSATGIISMVAVGSGLVAVGLARGDVPQEIETNTRMDTGIIKLLTILLLIGVSLQTGN
jgi:hypothetical protein